MYYKVVKVFNKKYYSAIVNYSCVYRCEYKIGEKTTPVENTGGLFVFKDLAQAKNFADQIRNSCILECEVKNPTKIKYRADLIDRCFASFWKNVKEKCFNSDFLPAPEGTYLVSELTPIKEVL